MKSRTTFKIFHSLIMIFYVVMYLTGSFYLDYKWQLPLKHRQLGIGFLLVLIIVFISINKKSITSILKNHLKWKGGSLKFKLFKLSVMLLVLHFVLTVVSGSLMILGMNLYQFHRLSKYIVPVLVGFHIIMQFVKKHRH